ncbi:hypothetical protein CYMTET_48750 [Cymbomonas tetramitiformis]|uniref:Uncharacterized protein n=1 Tax=Cymbomonas tetramitiformis TaxID=36881 RepID=A0AAE0BTD8_9CHLO|nr:hypothetical protein CYMTET_48750 [Cymbomonas tetramitiformis]
MGGVSEMSGSEVAECGESARSHEDNLFLEYEDTSYPSNTFEDCLGDSEEELCYDATSMDTLRPLYPGSACTLLQALLQLAQLVRSGTVPLAAVDRYCKFEHEHKLPADNCFPNSSHAFFHYFGVNKASCEERRGEYHTCASGCTMGF